jgi:tetratricopeptide (TPR) repeat protein
MEWFLAEHIQQFTFANGDNPLVWINTVLVKASSLEEAYEKAMHQGEPYNDTYLNSDQVEVTCNFRGLRDLYLIYEKLEDGAEIIWTEYDDLDEEQIAAMVTPKEKLAAFVTHGSEPVKLELEPADSRVESADPEMIVEEDELKTAAQLNRSAQAKRDTGYASDAIALYEQALLHIRKFDRPAERAYTLRHLADLHSQSGEIDKANREINEAISVYRDLPYGTPLNLANSLRVAALNAERKSQQLWREAAELYTLVNIEAGADEARLHIQHLSTLTATGEIQ